jgi:uncharacterized SAM-binding protein YcdF (DUF218 family)
MSRWRQVATTLEAWHLLRPRTGRGPTWRGWLALGLAAGLATATTVGGLLHPFLAVTARAPAGVLVVEGWIPDFALRAALAEFHHGGYRQIYVVGGPLEKGELLVAFGDHAEVGRATLQRLGAPADRLQAVPAPKVRRDRTFASAVALRDWLARAGRMPAALNVVTVDAHARRSRLLFEKAFGDRARIGIIALPDEHYDGPRWWRSSQGVRIVLSEWLGYVYARVFFSAADDLGAPPP